MRGLALGLLALSLSALLGCGGDGSSQGLSNIRAPVPVSNLAAISADGRVRLTWSAHAEADVVAFRIFRSTEFDAGYEEIGAVGASQNPFYEDLGPDQDEDGTPDGLTFGLEYHYKVLPTDRVGVLGIEALAPVASVKVELATGSIEDRQIENLRVFSGTESVLLTWDPLADLDLRGYRVYREDLTASEDPVWIGLAAVSRPLFADTFVPEGREYRYLVAPVDRDLREGRRVASRALSFAPGGGFGPAAPGVDPLGSDLLLRSQGSAGVELEWTLPHQDQAGTYYPQVPEQNPLIGGGTIVERALGYPGTFEPLTVLEALGSEPVFRYLDPRGTQDHSYRVRCFDRFGNLGPPSSVVSAEGTGLPGLVRELDAFASEAGSGIRLVWSPVAQAVEGYQIQRSRLPDRGFLPLTELGPLASGYTDASARDLLGNYYYRVAPLIEGDELRQVTGSPSPVAAATPGPSGGIFLFEAEVASVQIAPGQEASFGEIRVQARPQPFSGRALLEIPFTESATSSSFVNLSWQKEVNTDGSVPSQGTAYEAFLRVVRDPQAPVVDLAVEAVGSVLPNGGLTGRVGVDLFEQEFGNPLQPTMVSLGVVSFEDFNQGGPPGVRESIRLGIGFQRRSDQGDANARLLVDGLVLVRR